MLQAVAEAEFAEARALFQWAPTLGGECYSRVLAVVRWLERIEFQWAPTLGGECYAVYCDTESTVLRTCVSMGTHPWG